MNNMGMLTKEQKLEGTIYHQHTQIKELKAENARITDAYKALITKLNTEDRSDINITP